MTMHAWPGKKVLKVGLKELANNTFLTTKDYEFKIPASSKMLI